MEDEKYYGLVEFHRELFSQGYPLSGIVRSIGERGDVQRCVSFAAGQFFAWIGPGGIGQYSLDHEGGIHAIALGRVFTMPCDLDTDPVAQHSGGKSYTIGNAGLDFRTRIYPGDLPADLVEFVADSRTGLGKFDSGLMILVADGGKFGMFQSQEALIEVPKVELSGRVSRSDGKLIYTTDHGKQIDYSVSLVK